MRNIIDTKEKRSIITKMVSDHPHLPSKQLARMLYDRHVELFPNVEAARGAVRTRRGAQGEHCRKFKTTRHLWQNRTGFNWKLPPSQATERVPFELPNGKIICLSDIHFPFHDEKALGVAIEYARRADPKVLLLNGDTADFFGISYFLQDPRRRKFADEVVGVRQLLGYLRQEFPLARIIFKLGNHEERLEKYLWQKAPELLDLPQMQIEQILTSQIDETEKFPAQPDIPGIEFVKDKRIIKAGRLGIIHGHELPHGTSSPVNFARTLFLKTIECMLAGHRHQTSNNTVTTVWRSNISTWATGCLCSLNPDYNPIGNQWNHGFAEIDKRGDEFEVRNLRIIKGKVY